MVPHLPLGVGELFLQRLLRPLKARPLGQADAIFIAHDGARLGQTGGRQRLLAHQHAGAEDEAAPHPVRLLAQHRADLEAPVADLQRIARLEAQPLGKLVGDCRAVNRAALVLALNGRKRRLKAVRTARGQLHGAVKRIGVIDRPQLHQLRATVWPARHGPHFCDFRDIAQPGKSLSLLRACLHLRQLHLEITAQDHLPALGQPLNDGV
ncbi:hypothetical protein L0C21_07210 [Sphingosinicellaceae bacterium A1X5R2]|nr:hypothetical protein [Pedomonas mirosovicensis]MCH8685070.1 hypothetical protein [Pedomonas mirosovicensis]